jgi:hypothetical protein
MLTRILPRIPQRSWARGHAAPPSHTCAGCDGGAMMSHSAREQQALDSIEDGLAGSDPHLATMLAIFTRLASGEEMPARENVSVSLRQTTGRAPRNRRRSRRNRTSRHVHRVYRRLGFGRAALLLWLLITIALIAIGPVLSRGGSRDACASIWIAACAGSAPAHNSGFTPHYTTG